MCPLHQQKSPAASGAEMTSGRTPLNWPTWANVAFRENNSCQMEGYDEILGDAVSLFNNILNVIYRICKRWDLEFCCPLPSLPRETFFPNCSWFLTMQELKVTLKLRSYCAFEWDWLAYMRVNVCINGSYAAFFTRLLATRHIWIYLCLGVPL